MSSRDIRAVAAVIAATGIVALNACGNARVVDSAVLQGGSVARGKAAIQHYGCNACHAIAGFPEPSVAAAAPVTGIANRAYIAGMLPVTPDNLVLWIRFPRRVKPATAMPYLGVSADEARDIATYLYSLR